MTYNIRFDNEQDGLNKWENRKQGIVNLIEYYEPRILGVQEAMEHQLNYLDDNLTNYSRIGVGRDDGKAKGEFCAIYYDNNQLSLVNESTFWLSQRDNRVSVGWDASMERICTYGLFQDKINNNKILIFNTHYDHIGKIAREKSSELILNKIKEINKNGFPVILLGDFNSEPNSKPIKLITKELEDGAKKAKNGIYGPIGTFTGFKINTKAQRRIDYIFIKNLKVNTYRHIDDKMKDNNYLSDHLPVLIELEYLN
ncbi:endonuclease/exonuclease/phosphatase family protein [Winogradskyella sp. A2]|uniref:endonuclease/exonuclease/phosphatase family protein n=1 Tax=Winogradskyella sp. A2 TaxID=3366944 RepID=UPI00398C775B